MENLTEKNNPILLALAPHIVFALGLMTAPMPLNFLDLVDVGQTLVGNGVPAPLRISVAFTALMHGLVMQGLERLLRLEVLVRHL